MNRSTVASRWNLDLIAPLYERWKLDPAGVDESWRFFFEGYDLAAADVGDSNGKAASNGRGAPPGSAMQVGRDSTAEVGDLTDARAQSGVTRLVDAYRELGHFLADLDPLQMVPRPETHEGLELSRFGLSEADLDAVYFTKLADPPRASLRELLAILRQTYCGTLGVEYMHIQDPKVRRWLQDRMESVRNHPGLDRQNKQRILLKLNAASLFETFLARNFIGQKRFSLEGGEMLIPMLDALIERAGAQWGVREIVIGMPHRGRLNVLANILNKPYWMIFHEFQEIPPKSVGGDGDVKYHLGFSSDHTCQEGHEVHLSLTANPSHLEAVNPVVEGRVRAKQRRFGDESRRLGIPVLIHGDAAFAGQGLVAETLNLSQLPGYRTGGTVHIVVNNQIGFTTTPADSRSTRYCTDIAKMLEVPILHVNGEDPEACVYAAVLAMDFRQTFGQDVVIDFVCYRKHGHNEGDEPAFTQPLMYEKIRERPGIVQIYSDRLVKETELRPEDAESMQETFQERLAAVLEEVKASQSGPGPGPVQPGFQGAWKGFTSQYRGDPVETGVDRETLERISEALARFPEGFHLNPKLDRILGARRKAVESRTGIDWSNAEALAFGSLLIEGTPVRLSGQDSRRGTFSQRHSVLVDAETGSRYIPLNNIGKDQAFFCAYDSLLSEAAVLGFDYGYSLDDPTMLILWEAQFGDFANGAQVIIDQFITPAESKWGRASGLVMLLPHGYEGQGPEHSSARIERYLQACAEDNIQVVNCTTPAQYFHLLRRQMRRNFRKPLVVMTPKSLLRHKEAVSPLDNLETGGFREVIDDADAPDSAGRVIVCSGKIYYDLLKKRQEAGKERSVAIVRLEQLYPWPGDRLLEVLGRFEDDPEWVWAQEESQNMGPWTFVAPRLRDLVGRDFQFVGRNASASPATGSHAVHDREQVELVEAAIGAEVPHLV